jgi:hypothetical protein
LHAAKVVQTEIKSVNGSVERIMFWVFCAYHAFKGLSTKDLPLGDLLFKTLKNNLPTVENKLPIKV